MIYKGMHLYDEHGELVGFINKIHNVDEPDVAEIQIVTGETAEEYTNGEHNNMAQ